MDLDRQTKEIKAEHREALKIIKKLETASAKPRAKADDKRAARRQDSFAACARPARRHRNSACAYEQLKNRLGHRPHPLPRPNQYFVDELKARCGAMNDNDKRALVLELFSQDVQSGLDDAVA